MGGVEQIKLGGQPVRWLTDIRNLWKQGPRSEATSQG